MAPAQSTLAGTKRKSTTPLTPLKTTPTKLKSPPPPAAAAVAAATAPPPPPAATLPTASALPPGTAAAVAAANAVTESFLSNSNADGVPIDTVVIDDKKLSPDLRSALANLAAGEEKSSVSSSSGSNHTGSVKTDKYASIKNRYKKHKTPKKAKKLQQKKRRLPDAGDGTYNRVYTIATADGAVVVIVMHKKKANEPAFTKNIDDQLANHSNIRDALGIDHLFKKVDPDNGDQPLAIEYLTKDKESRTKYFTVYYRKPSSPTTKAKREKWARKTLIVGLNKYGQAKYARQDWGAEKFEYGGDLENEWTDYLADFLTYDDVAKIMKEDFSFSDDPLTCEQMASDSDLVEMYFGPHKVEQGKRALLRAARAFHTADDDAEVKPYQSEEDDDDDDEKPSAAIDDDGDE